MQYPFRAQPQIQIWNAAQQKNFWTDVGTVRRCDYEERAGAFQEVTNSNTQFGVILMRLWLDASTAHRLKMSDGRIQMVRYVLHDRRKNETTLAVASSRHTA